MIYPYMNFSEQGEGSVCCFSHFKNNYQSYGKGQAELDSYIASCLSKVHYVNKRFIILGGRGEWSGGGEGRGCNSGCHSPTVL